MIEDRIILFKPTSRPTLEKTIGEKTMLKAYRDHVAERAALGIPKPDQLAEAA